MTFLQKRELYEMFLESAWWRELSRRKREQAGKCERCGSRKKLQAHHRFYRENWFDTRLEDLECLCRQCHEVEHGFASSVEHGLADNLIPERAFVQESAPDYVMDLTTPDGVLEARNRRLINRRQFKELKRALGGFPARMRKTKRKPVRSMPKGIAERVRKGQTMQGVRPWHYNPTHRPKWVNRGSSTN